MSESTEKRPRNNTSEDSLTLAVVPTSGTDNPAVVFVDRQDGVPVPANDDERPINYVGVRIRPQHVLASCAIPVLLPWVRKPSCSTDWYLDEVLLKRALALDADTDLFVALIRAADMSRDLLPVCRAVEGEYHCRWRPLAHHS
jgi:hypothetical protein